MANTVKLGIWNRAPFIGSVSGSLDSLNKFLETSEYDTRYKLMPIKHEDIENLKSGDMPDVFILDGGEDINPARYGERNLYSSFSDRRDDIEFGFTRFMRDRNVRLSGICRGHQLLNVAYGGTLHQDIRQSKCFTPGLRHTGGHKVNIGAVSSRNRLVLKDFVGKFSFTVSSLHHQAVHDIAEGFFASMAWHVRRKNRSDYGARTEQGYVIEGIESVDGRVRGLQCHPEFRGYPKDGLMFAYLMHVDNFIQNLKTPTGDELEEKFAHLVRSKAVLKGKEGGPYKVGRNKLSNTMSRIRAEDAPSVYVPLISREER